jgi:hypothetical protein
MKLSELYPGDVLLFRSKPLISRLIRYVDESPVNHAAIVTGVAREQIEITHSSDGGVRSVALETLIPQLEQVFVRRLVEHLPAKGEAIADHARAWRQDGYGWETAALLALHIMVLRGDARGVVRQFFTRIFNLSAGLVESWRGQGTPVTCSELVWRAYKEAGYTLDIPEDYDLNRSHPSSFATASIVQESTSPAPAVSSNAIDQLEAEAEQQGVEEWLRRQDEGEIDPADQGGVSDSDLRSSAGRLRRALRALVPTDAKNAPADNPPLGPHLQGLVRDVGQATTPGDLFEERATLACPKVLELRRRITVW